MDDQRLASASQVVAAGVRAPPPGQPRRADEEPGRRALVRRFIARLGLTGKWHMKRSTSSMYAIDLYLCNFLKMF